MKEPVHFFFSKIMQQVTPQTILCISDRIISRGLLASSFARADMCKNPGLEDVLKENIQNIVFSLAHLECWRAVSKVFVMCDMYLWVKGNHFQHLQA